MERKRKSGIKPDALALWLVLLLLIPGRLTARQTAAAATAKPAAPKPAAATGAPPAIRVMHSFRGSDGADPWGSLTLVPVNGHPALFGRTKYGGAQWRAGDTRAHPGGGVIFRLPLGRVSALNLKPFSDSSELPESGYQPHHDSMLLIGGKLYGATLNTGGFSLKDYVGNGTIFTLDPATMAYRAIHNFKGPAAGGPGAGGTNPHSCFSLSPDGARFYGATALGGAAGKGTLYELAVAGGQPKFLYSFDGRTGADPHGHPVAVNVGGHDFLLGMTREGGAYGSGVIFVFDTAPGLDPAQAYTDVHDFAGAPDDGAIPDHGNLVVVSTSPRRAGAPPSATAYGMTTQGGLAGDGILFRAVFTFGAKPAVRIAIMHNFGAHRVADLASGARVRDGSLPRGSLLLFHRWLYGLTSHGGANGGGTVFRASPDPSCAGQACYAVLAAFDTRTPDAGCKRSAPTPRTCDLTGSAPIDNLIAGPEGKRLYGMTSMGGAYDPGNQQQYTPFGTVFSIPIAP